MSGKRKRKQRRKDPQKWWDAWKRTQRKDPQIWMDAVWDLRRQLGDHCRTSKPDKLRFQTGRLIENLLKRIEAAGEDRLIHPERLIVPMFCCYWFITTFRFGYDEPRRLHREEMKAVGLQASSRSFCRSLARRFAKNPLATVDELLLRLGSIVSWIEAQESFSMWLSFKGNRAFWLGGHRDERARAFQAWILATWMTNLGIYEYQRKGRRVRGMRLWEGLGVGTNDKGVPWNPGQWANILEQAARLAKKGYDNCTPLEQWVWWCYPVFQRYRWSAREVQDAASFRNFADKSSWEVIEKNDPDFRRYWITRGLRFTGRKTNRRSPPLAEFVRGIAMPTVDDARGVVVWRQTSLTKKN
jgi:hypothetical protein